MSGRRGRGCGTSGRGGWEGHARTPTCPPRPLTPGFACLRGVGVRPRACPHPPPDPDARALCECDAHEKRESGVTGTGQRQGGGGGGGTRGALVQGRQAGGGEMIGEREGLAPPSALRRLLRKRLATSSKQRRRPVSGARASGSGSRIVLRLCPGAGHGPQSGHRHLRSSVAQGEGHAVGVQPTLLGAWLLAATAAPGPAGRRA